MNNKTKTNLLHSVLIGLLFGYTIIMTLTNASLIKELEPEVWINRDFMNQRSFDLQMTEDKVELLFEEVGIPVEGWSWLENHTYIDEAQDQLDTLQENWEFYTGRHDQRLQVLEYKVREIEKHAYLVVNFPWVSQRGDGARLYEDDCASATALMIAKYYGVAGDETVDEVHTKMAGGDYSVDWLGLRNFLEDEYGLITTTFVTDEVILENLETRYNDLSDVSVSEYIYDNYPVAWIYAQTPHWIVRFQGWSYDPGMGMWPFEDTVLIYKPERGLGIAVVGVRE